jgi:hypothetical protein
MLIVDKTSTVIKNLWVIFFPIHYIFSTLSRVKIINNISKKVWEPCVLFRELKNPSAINPGAFILNTTPCARTMMALP